MVYFHTNLFSTEFWREKYICVAKQIFVFLQIATHIYLCVRNLVEDCIFRVATTRTPINHQSVTTLTTTRSHLQPSDTPINHHSNHQHSHDAITIKKIATEEMPPNLAYKTKAC
jgi:hypothetical protein